MIKSFAEVKFTGDEYAGFYSCGLTMQDSGTMRDFKVMRESLEETVYVNGNGVELSVSHVDNPVTNATEIITRIENKSSQPFTMEMMTSFMIKDIEADELIRLTSFWSAEGRVKVDKITDLNLEPAWNKMAFRVEKFGTIGTMPVRRYFPFAALRNSKTGQVTAVSLYAPAAWQIEVTARHDDTLTMSGGIADRDFGQWTKTLKPGESFEGYKAVVASAGSLEDVCDILVKTQNPDISPVDDKMGIVFNEYCTTWGNPTIENLKKIADKLEGKGIQYLVMDSGWYGEDGFLGYWFENVGDWRVNHKRFPKGLKELTDYIRAKGMIPGIWYEFESVGQKTELFNDPAHLLKKDGVPLTINGRRWLDIEDEWVEAFLTKNVIDNLRDNGFGYIKVDYNDTLGVGVDGDESFGEMMRRKIAATQKFFKKMKIELPSLVIENCSSGGHRLTPAFMELSSQASFSDAHEIVSLPLIAANLHRVIRPDQSQIWAVMRSTDSDARIFFSLCATFLGRMGLSGDIYDLSEHQWALIDEGMDFYRSVSHIIRSGKTVINYADTKSYNSPVGGQLVVREYEGKRLCVYHRFEASVSLEEFTRLCGINGIADCAASRKFGKADSDFSAEAFVI